MEVLSRQQLGVEVHRVQIHAMRSKWASCSSNGMLTLNADLLYLPLDLVDYVLCHDLLYLKIPNHGKGFRSMMGCYLPDWRERAMRLAGTRFRPVARRSTPHALITNYQLPATVHRSLTTDHCSLITDY